MVLVVPAKIAPSVNSWLRESVCLKRPKINEKDAEYNPYLKMNSWQMS